MTSVTHKTRLGQLYDTSSGQPRLASMEGLRGLAVLLVFFVHFHALFGDYASKRPWVFFISKWLGDIGNIGVDLFFVLSGYLIYGLLLRRRQQFSTFIWRRIQRIYPAFLAVLLIYLVCSYAFPSQNKIHGSPIFAALYILENALLLPGIFNIQPIIT